MNPADIQRQMLDTSRELQRLMDDHPRLVMEDAKASSEMRRAMAMAFLSAPGKTVAEREANRDLATIDEQHAAHLAKGLRESNKLAIDSLQARLTSLNSLNSSNREEMRLLRVGPSEYA